jgi:hypothetical protein
LLAVHGGDGEAMSNEIPPIRFYYRHDGPTVVLHSADPAYAVTVVAGEEAFKDLCKRNPQATFEPEPPRPRRRTRPTRQGTC